MPKFVYILEEHIAGQFEQRKIQAVPGELLGFDDNGDLGRVIAGSGQIQKTTAILKGNGTGGAVAATATDINTVINSTVAPVFANVTSKPTTAVGYGIVHGSVLDALGNKAVPTGVIVGDTDAQVLTNKTISGTSNDITVDVADITGVTTFTLATPSADAIVGFGLTSQNYETWSLGAAFSVDGTNPTRKLILSRWLIKSANYTAIAGDKIQVVTTSAAVTITLPAAPTVGDEVILEDGGASFATHNLTIDRNGLKINNASSNFTSSTNNAKLKAVYISTSYGWSVK